MPSGCRAPVIHVLRSSSARCKHCLRVAAGVYADLDFESLRNLEPLLRGRQVLLAAMTAEAGFVHNIPNAWMASVRRHPFWLFVLQEITRTVGAGDFTRRARVRARLLRYHQTDAAPPMHCVHVQGSQCHALADAGSAEWPGMERGRRRCFLSVLKGQLCARARVDAVEHTTGPIMLGRAVEAFRRANGTGLTVLEPGVIYPVNWRVTMHLHDTPTEENAMTACDPFNSAFSNERCKALFPDAYAITYWAHTWAPPGY